MHDFISVDGKKSLSQNTMLHVRYDSWLFVFLRRDQIAEQKEYRRKKQQKKAQRLKQMEEEREQEKNKWLDFNTKVKSWIQYKHQSPKTVMLSV